MDDRPLGSCHRCAVLSRFVSQKLVRFLARPGKEDLTTLHEFMKSGKVTP